jgi:RNA polymerase sigma-70 factor, ECF subfamily
MNELEQHIITGIINGDEAKLKQLYNLHFTELVHYALRIVNDPFVAEEIVQDVFVSLWEKRKSIKIELSIRSYLYASVKNRCINHLKSKYKKISHVSLDIITPDESNTITYNDIENKQLIAILETAINQLPEKCRIVFSLSRNTGLTNLQIAHELNISEKTVENQITIALRKLTMFLEKHWYIFISVFLEIFSHQLGGK